MVASSDSVWLQGNFNALVGLFDRVVLQTNVGKTVGMVCDPCQAAGNLTATAYGRSLTGEGQSYREQLRDQVACEECGELLVFGSLLSHLMTQHGRTAGRRRQWTTLAAVRVHQVYQMSFPAKGRPRICPVEGCTGRVATRTAIWVYFVYGHVLETVVMLEEGNFPYTWCPRCYIQVPQRALNGRHPGTVQCLKGAEKKIRRLAETETRDNLGHSFEVYREPIESVTQFKYLGIILTATDDDWTAVVVNLGKARRSLGRLSRVLGREVADPKASRAFYIAVTQAVLIFGS